MPEFLTLLPPPAALQKLLAELKSPLPAEKIVVTDSLGRVAAADVLAPHPLPAFRRSTVDGFAVRAADTHGASESLPAYLRLAGEVLMGTEPDFILGPGECALIHTGGMLPGYADAVVMVEHTQSPREGEVEVLRAVAVGENVVEIGEDVKAGEVVIPAGRRIRPAELGGLMALGIPELAVTRQPRAGILSTGDEVVAPRAKVGVGQVRDVNTYTLSALVEQAGGLAVPYGIVPDQQKSLRAAAQKALAENDLLIITAGSSASARDLTAQVIDDLGKPGVLVHGVNIKPGKPTILGVCKGKPVIGLPGNPVSALLAARIFVTAAIGRLLGLAEKNLSAVVPARLALNLSSQAGREDWVPVHLTERDGVYLANPIFSKSNLIFTLARADGLLRVPPDATGLPAGADVDVILL
jgi:molybdopterin molybdotransferase